MALAYCQTRSTKKPAIVHSSLFPRAILYFRGKWTNWGFEQYECRCFDKRWTQVMLNVTNNGKISPSPHFCIFIPFFLLIFWKCHTLDDFINNKFQNWFHFSSFFSFFFFYYFTSTTPFRSEPVLRDHTCDASLVCIWLYSSFILSFFFFFFFYLLLILFTSSTWHQLFQIYGENLIVFIEQKTKQSTTNFGYNVGIP